MMDETAWRKNRKRICCEYAWEKEVCVFHREVAASRRRLWGQRENWKNKTEDARAHPQLILGEPLHMEQCSLHLSQVGHGKSETWICLMVHREGKPGSYSSQEAKHPAALTTSNTGLFPPLMGLWARRTCPHHLGVNSEWCSQESSVAKRCSTNTVFTWQRWTKGAL